MSSHGASPRPSRRTTPRRTGMSGRESPKVTSACMTCRKKKVKCSGTNPCTYCTKRGLQCTLSKASRRRVYSVETIKELQDRLAAYENAAQARNPEPEVANNTPPTTQENLAVSPRPTLTLRNPPCFGNNTVVRGLGLPPQDALPGTSPHSNPEPSVPSPRSVIPTDPPLSSSYNFGSRVRSLVVESAAIPYPETANYVPIAHVLHSKTRSSNVFDLPTFPTEEEAYRLLNTHISFIGNTQNLFDAREVSDRIGLLYANRQDAGYNTANLETLEILLIFAIARLFLADFGRNAPHTDTVPGQTLFDFVCERIPPLGQLYSIGRLSVEILLLQAVYYVNINRKEEAYIHTSTALRLAVAHGFHRKHTQKHMLQSEATHINRLWWSVYLHERRLAAVTGNPFGINDSVIEQDLPTDSFGFTPAAPMRTSIKLAQIYGQIIMDLYNSQLQAEETFISKVQNIVKSLYAISEEIPLELTTGLPKVGPDLHLRTSSSLHLMFYQALTLTIRPIMLYISQLILQGQPLPCELHSSPLGKLSKTCTEAARRLLKVLKNLKENKFIALFGFFDLDGLISVSFVMILTAIFDSTGNDDHAIRPSPDLDEALGLVQFLANQGNKYAAQWLYEIRKTWEQLCSRVNNASPHTNLPEQTQLHQQAPNETNDLLRPGSHESASSQAHVGSEVAGPFRIDGDQGQFELGVPNPASNLADLDIWADIDQLWQPLPDEWEAFQNGITVVPQNFSQAVPGDPHWPLAGEEMGDIFAELGRHVAGSVS